MNGTNNAVIRSYVWGTDLSGTQTGAGGVGGLLIMNDVQNGTHFYGYDGNGNVALMVNCDNGKESANFEYGPFGEVIKQTGLMSKIDPFRFSTKRTVDSIDIILYEYRAYKPSAGTWLTREPIGEKGGRNLYEFVNNNPLNLNDFLGLWKIERKGLERALAKSETGDTVSDLARIIGFDDKDYKKWLKSIGGSQILSSVTEPIAGCTVFTIPNTVFVDVGLRINSPWYLQCYDQINLTFIYLKQLARKTGNTYTQNGFKVVYTEPVTGANIKNHLESENIHAYVFAGHGSNGGLNTTEDDAVFPGRYTQYGIQYMGLLSCGSALNPSGQGINNYPSNVARRGIFFGSINNYTALLAIIIKGEDFLFIQTQGTNP